MNLVFHQNAENEEGLSMEHLAASREEQTSVFGLCAQMT